MYLTDDFNYAHWPGAEKSGPPREGLYDRSQDPVLHPGEIHRRELTSEGRRRATKQTWKSPVGKTGRRGIYAGTVFLFCFSLLACILSISQERRGLRNGSRSTTRSYVCIMFF